MEHKTRFPFSKRRLEALPTPTWGRATYHDAGCPGLILRITANGVKSFCFYRKSKALNQGKPIKMHVGGFPEVSIEAARNACQRLSGKVADGIDPREERRAAKQPAPQNATLGELWTYYLENHAKPHKRSWRDDEKRYLRHLAVWKDKPLAEISTADVEQLHKKIGKTAPYEGNRMLALLSVMFRKAASKVGFDGKNPCKGIDRFTEEERERFLQPDELPRFFAALAELRKASPVVADALEVALWTGARKRNITSMSWGELSLQRAEWTIPGKKFKNGKQQTLHLPSPALDILTRRQAEARGEWVFPGRRRGQPLFDVYKPWRALLASSGLRDLRPHDLRRTMGSYETATGALYSGCRPDSRPQARFAANGRLRSHESSDCAISG